MFIKNYSGVKETDAKAQKWIFWNKNLKKTNNKFLKIVSNLIKHAITDFKLSY